MFSGIAAWAAVHLHSMAATFDPVVAFFAGFPCGSNTCVDVYEKDGLFYVASTRRVEAPHIPFDADEIVKFFDEVRDPAGPWTDIYTRAVALKAQMSDA